MKHKHLLFLLSVLMSMATSVVAAKTAGPDDDKDLNLYIRSSAEPVRYSISDLRKITFSEKGVQVWSTNWPTEYPYSQFLGIALTEREDETGIANLTASPVQRGEATYYDLQGRKVATPKQGIYIMRLADGTARKIMVK